MEHLENLCTVAGVAALLLVMQPSSAQTRPSMCPAHQQTLFSCPIKDKQVAICASDELTATTGSLQYRFGRPPHVELAYPASGRDWREVTRAATLSFSGGGGSVLTFDNRPYTYSVYTAIGQGWGSKSGVLVEKAGKRVANLKCSSKPTSELGPDLFSKAGITPMEGQFDLP